MSGSPRLKKVAHAALASAQRTGDANSALFDAEPYDHAVLLVDITVAASGSMVVYLETSDDKSNWYRFEAGGETGTLNSTGKTATKITGPVGKYVRVAADLAGATDLTFSADLILEREGV